MKSDLERWAEHGVPESLFLYPSEIQRYVQFLIIAILEHLEGIRR